MAAANAVSLTLYVSFFCHNSSTLISDDFLFIIWPLICSNKKYDFKFILSWNNSFAFVFNVTNSQLTKNLSHYLVQTTEKNKTLCMKTLSSHKLWQNFYSDFWCCPSKICREMAHCSWSMNIFHLDWWCVAKIQNFTYFFGFTRSLGFVVEILLLLLLLYSCCCFCCCCWVCCSQWDQLWQ